MYSKHSKQFTNPQWNRNNNNNNNNNNKNNNYNSNEVKTSIIDYLYNSINLIDYKYKLLQSIDDLKFLKENKHFVSPNFSGKNGFIIFKKIKNDFFSVMIDKKTLKYNKTFMDINNIKLIPLNIKAKASIYDGTIFDGKLIKIDNNKQIFQITDVLFLEGQNLLSETIDNKLINIKAYLDKNIKIDNTSKITFDINKLFSYDHIKTIILEGKQHPTYNMYGIIFYPYKSGVTILFNDIEFKNDIKVLDNKCAAILFKKDFRPDVYETYILNDNKKLCKCGIAYISTMKISKYCDNLFTTNINNTPMVFKCVFNMEYKKWEPVEHLENVTKPDTIQRIREIITTV
jgi:hypothetical protein